MSAPHVLRRLPAVPVYVGLLFVDALAGMLTFTVTNLYYVTELGMSPLALVLCGTAMELAIFVFEVPTGIVADVVSRRTSVVISYLVIGVAVIGFGVIESVPGVIACYALWGLGYTFQSGALDAWIADEVGLERLTPVALRGAQAGWAGALAGVLLSTVVAGASLQAAIVAGGVVTILLGLALALLMPETGFRPHATPQEEGVRAFAATARRGTRELRTHHVLVLLLGIAFAYGAWTESFDRLWVANVIALGLPSGLSDVAVIGALTAAALVAGILVGEVAVRRLADAPTQTLARVITGLTVGLLVASLLFALAGSFTLACVGYLGIVALRSLAGPLQSVWVNRTIEDSSVRATTLSMVSQADAVGQVAGGPAIGAVATAGSLRAGLGLGALLLLPAAALSRRAWRHLATPVGDQAAPGER
jgi:DHA3 family tetracycline resistance protein-like MFS transporter